MTIDEIISAVEKFDYKPGYRIDAKHDHDGWVMLRIIAYVPDSRGRTGDIKVAQVMPVMSEVIVDLEALKWMVHGLCQSLESHEIDEWLRFSGELVKDPHQ